MEETISPKSKIFKTRKETLSNEFDNKNMKVDIPVESPGINLIETLVKKIPTDTNMANEFLNNTNKTFEEKSVKPIDVTNTGNIATIINEIPATEIEEQETEKPFMLVGNDNHETTSIMNETTRELDTSTHKSDEATVKLAETTTHITSTTDKPLEITSNRVVTTETYDETTTFPVDAKHTATETTPRTFKIETTSKISEKTTLPIEIASKIDESTITISSLDEATIPIITTSKTSQIPTEFKTEHEEPAEINIGTIFVDVTTTEIPFTTNILPEKTTTPIETTSIIDESTTTPVETTSNIDEETSTPIGSATEPYPTPISFKTSKSPEETTHMIVAVLHRTATFYICICI